MYLMLAENLSEPSLWTVIVALASVVAFGGRHVMKKLQDCEKDRLLLHKKLSLLAAKFAARFGEVVDLDDVEGSWIVEGEHG